ncbi:MAG: D-tyrosyl-tRNA(Tyr) deacylase, partial [Clostridium sp.]|nr:D-tyrosyl-tRNA(Tyr) deacylase [Clostridium sp.]
MRAIVQRVKSSSVSVNDKIISEIDYGLNVLVGMSIDDNDKDLKYIGDKIIGLRIFDDKEGTMNLSVKDVKGDILIISQFTLYGDARKGRRPSYINALNPKEAEKMYDKL